MGRPGFALTAALATALAAPLIVVDLAGGFPADLNSMYAFRLIYYGHSHIVWGALRLRIVF